MPKYAPFLVSIALSAAPALANQGPAEVSLLPGWRMENGHHMVALRVELAEGWNTYWRAPGEGGIPPEIDWSRSDNIAAVAFHWPVPEVIEHDDVTTVGYYRELVLPIELTPARGGAPIHVEADLLLGICEEICMPLTASIDMMLPVAGAAPDPAIERALAARPDRAEEAGVRAATCRRDDLPDGLRLTARIDMPALGSRETVVFEAADPRIWVSEAQAARAEDGALVAHADFVPPDARPFEMSGQEVRLTVLANGRGVDIRGCDLTR